MNPYGRRELKGARVLVSSRMAANGVAVRCGRAIAWKLLSPDVLLQMLMLPVVRGYSLCKTVVPAKAGELDQHFRCRIAQTPAQERGGSGESLNRLPVGPYELIVADAGYCSAAGDWVCLATSVLMRWFASTLGVSWRTLYTADVSPSFRDYALCPKWGSGRMAGL